MANYIHITQEEFEHFMCENLFTCINSNQRRVEKIYTFIWGDGDYTLEVYSSIVSGKGGRSVGSDAIRVILMIKTSTGMQPMWKGKRVHRVKNWKKNLQQWIDEGLEVGCENVENWRCPQCGSPFILREGKHGKFYSCSAWPVTGCSCTANYEGD